MAGFGTGFRAGIAAAFAVGFTERFIVGFIVRFIVGFILNRVAGFKVDLKEPPFLFLEGWALALVLDTIKTPRISVYNDFTRVALIGGKVN